MERFWEKVDKSGDCWLWTAGTEAFGYGRFMWRGASERAHRVSYILTNGEIPEDACILHSCDVPACVNPAHLRVGTKQDNAMDCVNRDRHARAGGCEPGEKNPRAKLTTEQVLEMRELMARGTQVKEVAAMFGVDPRTASSIKHRVTWAHI